MSIKKRKILFLVSWLCVIIYLIGGLSYASYRSNELICNTLDVCVADSVNYRFVTSGMIKRLLAQTGKMPVGIPINSVNVKMLEDSIAQMVAVSDAQVYMRHNGVLRIDVRQRTPLVRVFNSNNQSYYVDNEGRIMPTLSSFSARVLVVTGNIREPFVPRANVDVMHWNDSLQNECKPLICSVLQLAIFIANDKFWNAQIEQIYVDAPGNILLIPTVGPHTIELGPVDGYKNKLSKLKSFYTNALPYEGWNRYRTINLKFSNQIICTKNKES